MSKKRSKKDKKKQIFLLGLCALFLLMVAVVVISKINERNDRLRFAHAETAKSKIANTLADRLGDNIASVRDRNECFYTEQGPFDRGRLWCQVGTVIELNQEVEYSSIGQEYLQIGRDFGEGRAEGGIFPDYRVDLPEEMSCHLQFRDVEGNNFGGARKIIFERGEGPVISVTCADRARAMHYPYTD